MSLSALIFRPLEDHNNVYEGIELVVNLISRASKDRNGTIQIPMTNFVPIHTKKWCVWVEKTFHFCLIRTGIVPLRVSEAQTVKSGIIRICDDSEILFTLIRTGIVSLRFLEAWTVKSNIRFEFCKQLHSQYPDTSPKKLNLDDKKCDCHVKRIL